LSSECVPRQRNQEHSLTSRPQQAFDYVIDVKRIANDDLSHLRIMGRVDLASTFTKIALWQQIQFRKIVYLDADTLPLRAPDELFDLDTPFAAAPELGFPDCFNSGVMVLEPSTNTYESLRTVALRGGSFDGGDQGLLNIHFPDFHRLSFFYNMELYHTYRLYMPAVLRFQSKISVLHFIGKKKPWDLDPPTPLVDSTAYSRFYREALGKWWSVYEKPDRTMS
jgi:glycogenin